MLSYNPSNTPGSLELYLPVLKVQNSCKIPPKHDRNNNGDFASFLQHNLPSFQCFTCVCYNRLLHKKKRTFRRTGPNCAVMCGVVLDTHTNIIQSRLLCPTAEEQKELFVLVVSKMSHVYPAERRTLRCCPRKGTFSQRRIPLNQKCWTPRGSIY